jgi:hypothetical protein
VFTLNGLQLFAYAQIFSYTSPLLMHGFFLHQPFNQIPFARAT